MHFVAAAFECESENLNLKKCATGYKAQDRARVSQVARTMLSSQTMRHCSAAQRTGPTHTCMCMRSSGHARSWFSNYPSRYAGVLVLVLVLVPWYWCPGTGAHWYWYCYWHWFSNYLGHYAVQVPSCLAPTLQDAWNATCPAHEYRTPLISWYLSKHSRGADRGPRGPTQSCNQSQDL